MGLFDFFDFILHQFAVKVNWKVAGSLDFSGFQHY